MNINRRNYEKYFLLYVDDELSIDERNAVELFLQQNPDLQIEFDNLKKSIVNPQLLEFKYKEQLIKKEDDSLQENLLLLLDNELTIEQQQYVKSKIYNELETEKEWLLLKQVKFISDTSIVFDNKKLLYKKETSIIYIYWKRAVIAAAMIGFGFWAGIKYLNKVENIDAIKFNANNILIKPINIDTTIINTALANPTIITQKKNSLNNKEIKNHQKALISNSAYLEKISSTKSNKEEVINVSTKYADLALLENKTPPANVFLPTNEKVDTQTALITEEENYETKIFSIDEKEIRKSKLGKFIQRARKAFENTASVKIKAGENLKIGNFEIAIK